MKITTEVLEAHLACKTKGHLKLAGQAGVVSDYEAMTLAAGRASRQAALANLVARLGEGDAYRGAALTADRLKGPDDLRGAGGEGDAREKGAKAGDEFYHRGRRHGRAAVAAPVETLGAPGRVG